MVSLPLKMLLPMALQDKNGQKMSKRLNAVDPFETLAKYGADATRWYMVTNAPPWDNLKFNIEDRRYNASSLVPYITPFPFLRAMRMLMPTAMMQTQR